MKQLLKRIVAALVIVIAALTLSYLIRVKEPAVMHPERLPYAAPGPHNVGVRTRTIDGDTPFEVTIWYPARSDATQLEKSITYAYAVKMVSAEQGTPLATYRGYALPDAPEDLGAGPYPLVILSPGFAFSASTYGWLAEHLASYGFVVMAPDHVETLDPETTLWRSTVSRPQDVLALFDYVDSGEEAALIDAETVAVMGHSYGGYTALAAAGAHIDTKALQSHCERARASDDPSAWLCDMLTPHLTEMAGLAGLDTLPNSLWPASADPRVDAIIPLASDAFLFGDRGLAAIEVPVLVMGGTADTDAPYAWGTQLAYDSVSSRKKIQVAFEGGDHMLFTGRCESTRLLLIPITGEFCDDAGWDRQQAHDLTAHLATAFLLVELRHDDNVARLLAADSVDVPGVRYEATGY